MDELVIDTSVIIKWYALPREPGFQQAKTLLLNHVRRRCLLHIPLLALYEVGNVVTQFGTRSASQPSLGHLADVFALGLSAHELTLPRALLAAEIARTFAVSFYDACFVGLAQERGVPLVTADERLCRQTASLPFICFLSAYQAR